MLNLRQPTLLVLCFIAALLFYSGQLSAQRKITLDAMIQLAESQSRDAIAAKHRFRASFWEYRTFRTQYYPMLKLNTILPSLSRSIIKYTTNEGKDIFLKQSVANYGVEMSLSKTVGATGGQLYLKSGLDRVDNFSDSTTISSYLSNPVTIGFTQPLLAYNPYKWDNKIEPLKYEEARRKYLEDIEQININATNFFFDLLQAQLSLKIARINQANYDTLYKIAQGRYNLGRIAENELLQLELSYLKSNAGVETAELELENNNFRLKSFLRIDEKEELALIPPGAGINLKIEVQKAIAEAKSNRSAIFGFQRQLFEAASQIQLAKLANRFNANLYAEYGLTQSASELKQSYRNPEKEQLISFGISIPILDWGLAHGKIKMAQSNSELVRTSVEQQQIDFEQEVYLKVMQFNMQKNQLNIASKADTVAQKRYFVTKQRYLIGKIDITDLNIAQTETDESQLGFISALRSYWKNYYDLRKLTLYDFLENKPILVDFNAVLK